eukprot:403334250
MLSLNNPLLENALDRNHQSQTQLQEQSMMLGRHLNGKVGVMGGSKEYTGAPFYVGAASLRSGADIVHVFCPEEASIPIKSYSPELIVHPILTDEKETIKWLDACTSISIGSGLGRDPKLADTLAEIIEGVSKTNLSLICDADILWYMYKSNVKEQFSMKQMRNRAVMTPNVVEFQRMFEDIGEFDIDKQNDMEAQFYEENKGQCGIVDKDHQIIQPVVQLAQSLNNAIILKKGIVDLVSDGKQSYYVCTQGSLKRCGGQGDILSGILGTFVNYADNLKKSSEYSDLEENERKLLAVVSASSLNRMIAMNAYEQRTISLTTPDILDTMHQDDEFFENYISTIGVDFWDTAGQERYRTITNAYYRGADGIILVFDLYKMQSFSNLHQWLKEVEKHAKNDVNIIIIGNKSDMTEQETPEVSEADMQKFTQETGIPIFTASAKTGNNVENSFLNVTTQLIQKAQSNVKESLYGSTPGSEHPKKMKENQPSKLNRANKQDGAKFSGLQTTCCSN